MLMFLQINKQTVLKDDNPILRQKSSDVTFPISQSNKDLMNKMKTYLKESNIEEVAQEKDLAPAVGIAAPQIGVNLNMFALIEEDEEGNTKVEEYINPKIRKKSKELAFIPSGEGCLSVEEKQEGYVYRNYKIEVEYFDLDQKPHKETLTGFKAVAFQHEYDHLNGILYTDHINKKDPYYEKAGAIEV